MFNIEEQKINISCPECSFENSVTLKQVKNQESVVCGGCKRSIKLVDKNGSVRKATEDIKRGFDELERSLEKLKNIKINIKF